jgi:hypothetical protein
LIDEFILKKDQINEEDYFSELQDVLEKDRADLLYEKWDEFKKIQCNNKLN